MKTNKENVDLLGTDPFTTGYLFTYPGYLLEYQGEPGFITHGLKDQ